jgi:hypothetical protein
MTFLDFVQHFETSLQLIAVVIMLVVMGLPLSYLFFVMEKRSKLADDHFLSGLSFAVCVLGIAGLTIAAVCTGLHSLTLL